MKEEEIVPLYEMKDTKGKAYFYYDDESIKENCTLPEGSIFI
ncbi:hypothetical protein ACU4D9_00005 (plasmid) [Campylobacter jejuni]